MNKENQNRTEEYQGFIEETEWDILLGLFRQNRVFSEAAGNHYSFNPARIALLQNIIEGLGCGRKEELISQIYQYGSMLSGRDLVGRQLFLWLSAMAQEAGCPEEQA